MRVQIEKPPVDRHSNDTATRLAAKWLAKSGGLGSFLGRSKARLGVSAYALAMVVASFFIRCGCESDVFDRIAGVVILLWRK
jgi:hypothetical protein